MIVDNFDLFKKIINPLNDDEFYFVQILIRGKDGHTEPGVNGNNKNRLIKFYTIKSAEHLARVEDEIKAICNAVNGRAYIHPTKRSFKAVGKECLRVTTEMFLCENNTGLKGAYSTACGKSYITADKKFIVDLDGENASHEKAIEINNYITQECETLNQNKYCYRVYTAHGMHLITTPFNTAKFSKQFPNIDIHKNNPTLLYFNCLE